MPHWAWVGGAIQMWQLIYYEGVDGSIAIMSRGGGNY